MQKILDRLLQPYPLMVIFILLVAAYLRLWRISEYMTFLGDEGRDVLIVKRMLVDHKFTLLGPTASVGGFFLGPIYYYFMLPFLWLWRLDPTGPAVMVGLFGIATVYVVYRLGREMFSESVGMIASAIYTLSPVVIAYSRSSWNPNIVPFFASLTIYSLWRFTMSRQTRYLLLLGISLGVGIQLHYLFLFLFVVAFFWIIREFITNRFPASKLLSIPLVGFVIGNSLFLLFEIRHGFPNTISIIRFLFTGKDTGFNLMHIVSSLAVLPYRMFGRLVLALPENSVLDKMPLLVSKIWMYGIILLVISAILVSVHQLWRRRNTSHAQKIEDKEYIGLSLLFFWFTITLLMYSLYKRDIYDYYFGIIFPLPALYTGFILWKLFKFHRTKILSIVATIIILFINWQARPFRYEPNNLLKQTRTIAREALYKTNDEKFNFALLAGQNTDHTYRYFFEIWGNTPVTIENLANDPDRKTVTNQLIVICEEANCHPVAHPLWEIAGFGQAEIAGQWDVSFVKIYRLVHYKQI